MLLSRNAGLLRFGGFLSPPCYKFTLWSWCVIKHVSHLPVGLPTVGDCSTTSMHLDAESESGGWRGHGDLWSLTSPLLPSHPHISSFLPLASSSPGASISASSPAPPHLSHLDLLLPVFLMSIPIGRDISSTLCLLLLHDFAFKSLVVILKLVSIWLGSGWREAHGLWWESRQSLGQNRVCFSKSQACLGRSLSWSANFMMTVHVAG